MSERIIGVTNRNKKELEDVGESSSVLTWKAATDAEATVAIRH